MEEPLYGATDALSQMFMLPAAWFEGPMFVVNVLLPFIALGFFFHMMLSNKVRVFRNGTVNLALGFCLAFFAIPFSIAISPYATIFVAVFGIVTLMGSRITLSGLLLALLAASAAWFLVSFLANTLSMAAA